MSGARVLGDACAWTHTHFPSAPSLQERSATPLSSSLPPSSPLLPPWFRSSLASPSPSQFPACYLPRPRPRPLAASLTIPTLATSLAAVAPVDPLQSSSDLLSRPPSLPRRHLPIEKCVCNVVYHLWVPHGMHNSHRHGVNGNQMKKVRRSGHPVFALCMRDPDERPLTRVRGVTGAPWRCP